MIARRHRSLWIAGVATAAVYAWLAPPGFAPLSARFDTSRHGPHEARFLSGWRVEQHRGFRGNIVTRLADAQGAFELPPIPTSYPLILKINVIPWDACRFTLNLNGHVVGTLVNTVRGRGEKRFFKLPDGIIHPRAPNRLTIINETPERSTEWESIQVRNYYGTVRAPYWYLLGHFGPPSLRWWRLAPWHLIPAGLLGALAWWLTTRLRRRWVEWLIHWLLWGLLLGASIGVVIVSGMPLAATPMGFWIWWLWPSAIVLAGRSVFLLAQSARSLIQSLASTQIAIMAAATVFRAWAAWWDRRLKQWPARWVQPTRRLIAGLGVGLCITVTIVLTVVLAVAELVQRWWRGRPRDYALYAAGVLMAAGGVCWYFQLAAAAEWLGTMAFAALLFGLFAMLAAPASQDPAP